MKDKIQSGIYKLECIPNGKVYIGSSKDLEKRKKQHFSSFKMGHHLCKELQKDFEKFGINNFRFIVIKLCSEEEFSKLEYEYINSYRKDGCIYNSNSTRFEKKLVGKIMNQLEGFDLKWLSQQIVDPMHIKGKFYPTFYSWVSGDRTCPEWLLKELSRITNRKITRP